MIKINQELLDELTRISKKAGAAIIKVYESGDLGVTHKDDEIHSPLTRADTEANNIIIKELSLFSPKTPVLSEEIKEAPFSEREGWREFFLVDPLDGTKEFIKQNDQFTVNIALIRDGIPIAGVVYAPALHTTYVGATGLGAFKDTGSGFKKITTSDYRDKKLKLVASSSHRGTSVDKLISNINDAGAEVSC
ncbi:MAG: 3'(2'),5'-bisphosphate nucleotidase CysQ, partial [Deltaproteobacteria bacterium]|nr:3'(2'),5'-bisphosphate nucleotidase CysQ [Deltaproteobacteria bacterium]